MSFQNFPPQQYYQNVGTTQGYVNNTPINIEVYKPTPMVVEKPLGLDMSALIGKPVLVQNPAFTEPQIVTSIVPAQEKKKRKKKTDTDESQSSDKESSTEIEQKNVVENTVYADTYAETNSMTYGIINQTDELLRDCKQELEYIKTQRGLKGRYHYINDTINSMGTLLNTKLAAVKEINSTIKNVNDNEYRRFKDFRAMSNLDDNKAVMDAYSAFISAPVGAPEYHLPGTINITSGQNGIIQANYPTAIQANMDSGLANYMSNLTPEENLMLNDNNKDIEEVIVYDQATGAKYFQWMNTRTGDIIPNMPVSSELTIEDFTIDPRTKLAKNSNLNCIKKVVVLNEGAFDRF